MAASAAAAAVVGGRRQIAHRKEMALKQLETNIDGASVHIQTGDITNPRVYSTTCMKLGSSVDSAIAMNVFPSSVHLPKLLSIVKEVYRRNTELLQPSLMLLMLPIKAACKIGWFPDGDKDVLLMMAKEVSYGFSNTEKMNIEPSNAHSSVSNIVSRFYPTMKVEHVLTSFDVKAGYGTFVADFHISLGTTPRNCRNLWLLVAQLDNMDTAACITSPLNVDFLINGSGVPTRTRNDMEKGPQPPSDITKMIKYGLNLIQVFGEFDGQYLIALAFMNLISSPDPSQLQDYIRPMSGGADSDCDGIEMSSRISLCCPISQRRIKTPVKGHLCKHAQCFDYNYFIEVNSTKPTWKCPLCNNPVCYQDIRVDQDFLKILNEVAKDVNDVIISEDGSWMAAETNSNTVSPVTTPAVSLGQTEVNVCTTTQAQSTTVFTSPAGSPGQTQVNICATNQDQTTTMFTPPATNQYQTTTMFTPPATVTKPPLSPGQTQVNVRTAEQAQSTTVSTAPAGSPGQIRVDGYTTSQGQSTTMFTPPATVTKPVVSPGQTQVNIRTAKEAQSTTLFTPPAGSHGQSQVNICRTNQAQSTPMFTSPTTNAASPGQNQVNVYATTQAKSTTMFTTPGESQPAPRINGVSPTQPPEASGDAMPTGRMRGSLRGEQLEAARLQYLAPPQQPARANEPWSRPPIPSLPSPFLRPRTPANSDNV